MDQFWFKWQLGQCRTDLIVRFSFHFPTCSPSCFSFLGKLSCEQMYINECVLIRQGKSGKCHLKANKQIKVGYFFHLVTDAIGTLACCPLLARPTLQSIRSGILSCTLLDLTVALHDSNLSGTLVYDQIYAKSKLSLMLLNRTIN